jgi:hypothetical protein
MRLNDLKDLFPKFNVDTYGHVLGHVVKAAGKLAGLDGDADHYQERCGVDRDAAYALAEEAAGKPGRVYVADLFICAGKLAALYPAGEFEPEEAVRLRMDEKRDYLAQYRNPRQTALPLTSSERSRKLATARENMAAVALECLGDRAVAEQVRSGLLRAREVLFSVSAIGGRGRLIDAACELRLAELEAGL